MAPNLTKTQIEKIVHKPVKSFTTGEGAKKGDNVAGNLLAIKVQTESGQEINLVYKTLPEGAARDFAVSQSTFHVENAYYMHLAPAMLDWAKANSYEPPAGCDVLPIPKFYDGFNDDSTDYVCMADLRPEGYVMADKYESLSFEQTSLVLRELGRLHAISYCFLKWEGEKLFSKPEFSRLCKNMKDEKDNMFAQAIELFRATYHMSIDLIGQKDQTLKGALEKVAPKTLKDFFGTAMATDDKYFPVIILGDVWVNNILFKYGEGGSPEFVKFIDFQLVRRGNIYEELGYFIFTSTTPATRKSYLPQLLTIYYDSFVSTIRSVKYSPPANFTKGSFMDNFFENYFPSFVFMTFAIPMQLGTPMDFGTSSSDSEGGPPPQTIPPEILADPNFDPAAFQLQMLVAGLKSSMESSPRAVDRIYSIAQEMAELKVI